MTTSDGSSLPKPYERIRLSAEYHVGAAPDWHIGCFSELEARQLAGAGILHALFDLDGCLTPAYAHTEIDPHAHKAIRDLRDLGVSIDLTTNNEWDVLSSIGRILELDRAFQPPVVGEEVIYKPDEIFFRMILDGLGDPDPSTVVMIGDNPVDAILGAQRFGMKTVLVDRLDPDGFFA